MKRGHGIVDHVLQAIQGCHAATGTTLVGIDGPGGAGKGVLAASIARKGSCISVVDALVTVVSVDGLITMKKIAGRLQDLSDVERLEGAT